MTLDNTDPNNDGQIIQTVNVSGDATTGDITIIGKIVNIVKHPAEWQDAIWHFLRNNWTFLLVTTVFEILLVVIYLRFQNLYLIPWSLWLLAASALATAIWGWYAYGWLQDTRRAWRTLLLAILTTLGFVIVLGQQAWNIVYPEKFESQVFGIAIADLGEGPDYSRTARAREISGQLYEHLCQALKSQFAGISNAANCTAVDNATKRRIELRHIGVIPSSRTAQTYGQQINADVIIWGNVLISGKGGATIHFEVRDIQDRAVNPEYAIVLPVTTTSTDIIVREYNFDSDATRLKEIISQQAIIISSFTIGLISYLNVDFPSAVTRFEEVAHSLENNKVLDATPKAKSLINFYLGNSYNAMGRIQEGQEWLVRAYAANPEEPAISLTLALGYGGLGQVDKREESFSLALNQLQLWLSTHPEDNAALYDRGLIYQLQHQYTDAFLDFETLTKRDPNYYIAYINMGQVAANLGRFEESESSLRTALALAVQTGANSSWAHLNLAVVYARFGKVELAQEEYRAAIKASPDVDWMHYYYALFLERQKKFDDAISAYQKAIEVTHNQGWAYGNLASLLRRRGMLQASADNYMRAVHAEPENALLRTFLAETYAEMGDAENARSSYEAAIARAANNYYVYASYAGALFQWHDFARAAQFYQKALELHPNDPAILLNLGLTYENLNRRDEATQAYLQILSLNKHDVQEEVTRTARDRLRALESSNP